ncbi:MAG TPA: SurA N-terminal domain-containing protein [Verrucomicrobiae bacterium]|nr:SurA N-terminal domain-containing protein [Verrucomicrobiae bacterium]
MIGTIRKHSKWLWWFIAGLTIISFIYWGAAPATRNSAGGRSGDLGSIGGQKVTPDAYLGVKAEVYIEHWLNTHRWPDRDPNYSAADLQRDIYIRLMLIQKAEDLGIHIGNDAVIATANQILSSPNLIQAFGINGQSVPMAGFVKAVLQPENLSAADFENLIRHELVLDQLRQMVGLSGKLITPEEAATVYQRQYQKISAQIVVFSASNYLAAVPVTPAIVGQFYTNYLAEYRLPDRVEVNYVAFPVTNFMAGAEQKLTNLNDQVESIYNRYGTNAVADAKTPEDAKGKIRDALIREQALADARQQADDFANTVFNLDPVRPENLATVARQKGLAVQLTAPFSQEYGPAEFTAPEAFTKAAFGLTTDEPLAGPIVGRDAIYVIALGKQLPSEIPPLSQIRARVTQDYRLHEGVLRAQEAGTNFVETLQSGLAAGKSFAAVCTAAGVRLETLPPFSLSTAELPELGGRVAMNQLKAVAFATPIGHASNFEATDDGGFIVYVKSQLPLDTAAMNADLPQFTQALRQQRETAAFYNWLNRTGSHDLRDTPLFQEKTGAAAP